MLTGHVTRDVPSPPRPGGSLGNSVWLYCSLKSKVTIPPVLSFLDQPFLHRAPPTRHRAGGIWYHLVCDSVGPGTHFLPKTRLPMGLDPAPGPGCPRRLSAGRCHKH